jgi:maleate cis-trans isomerase
MEIRLQFADAKQASVLTSALAVAEAQYRLSAAKARAALPFATNTSEAVEFIEGCEAYADRSAGLQMEVQFQIERSQPHKSRGWGDD